jgi:hypothetical protein
MLAQPGIVPLAQPPGMRRTVAGNISLHDPALIRRGLAAQTKIAGRNGSGGEIIQCQIRSLPYRRIMAVTEPAPLRWHQTRLAVDYDTTNTRLKLVRRFEPDVVF